jgi:hypothetical protein
MTRPDGTEQFEDDKGIKHLKNGASETLLFANGLRAKLENGQLTEFGDPRIVEKREFTHGKDGKVDGFKDADGTVVKRTSQFDKDGYAQWETKTGEKVTARISIERDGVAIKDANGREYDFGPEGDIKVINDKK